ncbi:uncharacterized protein LOC121045605 [Ixodes scapularis]|uniref:uncharacterized protein LOC121045605 n=1 Tax=Ixodes scapularis TaxID=6945 RepID=UPI001AD6AA24|nr:uncharacterized protein LOC121045605 [Ixodes scapularis]
MYAVEVLDGRFCYIHKHRHVDKLSILCAERAAMLLRLGSGTVTGGLHRLPSPELQQLLDELASRSPLRSLTWPDVAPLCQLGRLRHLKLERILVTHPDMRAILAAMDPEILTQLTIRCKCQDLGPGPGWDERVRGGCHEERQRDVVSLVELVGQSRDLQRLQTDFELDVERLATSGPYPCLRRLTLTRLTVSGMPRSALTGRELQMLLLQMPALRELRCNVAHALAEVGVDAQSMLGRLEVVNVLLDQPAQAAGISPVELLARFCPNIREALADACPALKSLVARCFFNRRRADIESPRPNSTMPLLEDLDVDTLVDASVLLPMCTQLTRLRLTLSQLTATDARELADLCLTHCPRLQQMTLQLLHAGCSHRAAVYLLQHLTRVPQLRIFSTPSEDMVNGDLPH